MGVVMGLAWNPMGGSPVFIEAAAIPTAVSETGTTMVVECSICSFGTGGSVNVVTGQLGSVMKESVSIAYTFARRLVMEKYSSSTSSGDLNGTLGIQTTTFSSVTHYIFTCLR